MKLDLTKFHNLRKGMDKKKRKSGSRNVHVSVNRSNSWHSSSIQNTNNEPNNRKTHSVTSK